MYCSKCGTAIPQNAAFCAACGQPVDQPPTLAPNAPGFATATAPAAAGPYGYVASAGFPATAYAGFWLRVVAHLIDGLLAGIGFVVLAMIGVAMVGVGHFKNLAQGANRADDFFTPDVIGVVFVLVTTAVLMVWLYYAGMESSVYQGTLGKMALGLIVTDLQGRKISFGRASGRYFAKIITGLIPLGIGYAMAGFTEKKQALHDMIASCLVLRKI
jgi:uncharacterized RDD family membrane protein YckC